MRSRAIAAGSALGGAALAAGLTGWLLSGPLHIASDSQCLWLQQRGDERVCTMQQYGSNYCLRLEQWGEYDAASIYSEAENATVLGIRGGNVSLSTVKISNTGQQTAGAVLGVLGLDNLRTAPVVSVQNFGQGSSYNATGAKNRHNFRVTKTGAVIVDLDEAAGNGFELRVNGIPVFSVDAAGNVAARSFNKR